MHWLPRRRRSRPAPPQDPGPPDRPHAGVAVLRQGNGELTEDVVILGPVDAEARTGPPPGEQVLHTEVVDEILGRSHPADPVPGTLPAVERPPQARHRRG